LFVLTEAAPEQEFVAQCLALGISPIPPDAIGDRRPILRFGRATAETIRAGLQPPFAGFLEPGENGIVGVGRRCLDAVRQGGLAISVFTSAAFSCNLTQLFEDAVRERYRQATPILDGSLSICLAEALSNAVIHGNLGIDSGLRETRQGLAQFHERVTERLADPALVRGRVEISLYPTGPGSFRIVVSDSGQGFDLSMPLGKLTNVGDKHGRGLSLIGKLAQEVSTEDDGRTIVMAFTCDGKGNTGRQDHELSDFRE
jgi:anti-sigma regulatory factor (Ser/Thr protein kinase)